MLWAAFAKAVAITVIFCYECKFIFSYIAYWEKRQFQA